MERSLGACACYSRRLTHGSCQLEKDDANLKYAKPLKVRKSKDAGGDGEGEVVSGALSKKILDQAREQQAEIDREKHVHQAVGSGGAKAAKGDDSDSDAEEFQAAEADQDYDDEEFVEEMEITEADEATLESFMSNSPFAKRSLADIIMEKIREKVRQRPRTLLPRHIS